MKKTLILGVICTLVNFASIAHSYPIKYIAESSSTETSGSTGATGESGGNQSGSAGSGTTGGSSTPNSNGNVDKVESANPEVELDGAIGPWESGKDGMPNFENIESGDLIGEKPSEENLFKISVTVPLNMDFVIVNENENGSSPFGKFVSPYHSITNNGTYPLNVSIKSFDTARASNSSGGGASIINTEQVETLYVEEPRSNDGKVQMRLSLNYDRPQQGTYLKTIGLHNLSEATDKTLGEIGSNETARIYYRSDLWETPKSENKTTDVVSNFNLILSFSTQNTNAGTGNEAGGSAGTGSEGNASSKPSSGNITSGGSNGGADSGSGSTGSGENSALQNSSES